MELRLPVLRRLGLGVVLWCLAGLGALATGLPAHAGNLPGELPTLVGRLNAVSGSVQWWDRDSGGWRSGEGGALNNWPVATGDRLRTGPDSRAELRIGSTTLRLGAGVQIDLQQLDEQAVVLQLQDGSLALRLAAVDADGFGPVEVRTREGRWLPRRPGSYRFDRETDATQASVWRGELQFEGHDSAITIPEGRRADLWLDRPDIGRRAATRYAWANIQRDSFADWVARDERQDDASISARYVPPGVTGWQDLDRNGDWIADTEQGPLWLPNVVAPGWAPYQVGRWAWVSPWGWTWIDAAPWGFAPFHYGSWLRFDGRWAWSPGPRGPRGYGPGAPRVHYAPALSAWIGGPGVGISVQIGGRRPPSPRVVVPTVPVIVVRPGYARPLPPPHVVLPRPDRHGDDRRDDGRQDHRPGARPEARPDNRPDTRPELRPGSRPELGPNNRPNDRPDNREQPRMTVPRPQVRAPQPQTAEPPAAVAPRPPRAADDAPRPPARAERPERPAQIEQPGRPERPAVTERQDRPERGVGDNRRDGPNSGPNRGNPRDLAR